LGSDMAKQTSFYQLILFRQLNLIRLTAYEGRMSIQAVTQSSMLPH